MGNFEKLKAKWDKKLLDSGFVDLENKDGSLKETIDPRTVANALKDKEAREIYYSMATEFLIKHKFLSRLEKAIWSAHIDGVSFRDIAQISSITFYRVRKIVTELQKLAGVKR